MVQPNGRLVHWLGALAVILVVVIVAPPAAAAAPAAYSAGLSVESGIVGQAQSLVVRSAERFTLQFVGGDLVGWYDLRRDPGELRNLVAGDGPLLVHEIDGAPLPSGDLTIVDQSPVRVILEHAGVAGEPPAAFRLRYIIWVGGQVDVDWQGLTPLKTSLQRDESAITGAALTAAPVLSTGATISQVMSLFLDAWVGEARAGEGIERDGVIRAAAPTAGVLKLPMPPGLSLRAPRFEITSWPEPALTLRREATILVAGQDYLADYDPGSATLVVQYLHPLPAAPEGTTSFSFAPVNTPALSLTVQGRTMDENGLLVVDGNLPDANGTQTTLDLFAIPYIQDNPILVVSATFQGTAAGVEMVLSGGGLATPTVQRVLGQAGVPLQARFALPARGEYRLEGYLLDASGARQSENPADLIAPLGYGRIVMTIGDSITAGFGGDMVAPGDPDFPVTEAARSPAASADGRNFFQYDNANGDQSTGTPASFYRGYQLSLNDRLSRCTAAPVFVLNSGISGLRTRLQPGRNTRPPNRYAYPKIPAYVDLVQKLGARYLFIGLGTNDASDALDVQIWATDGMGGLIGGLQSGAPGVRIWVPSIPYRTTSAAQLNRTRNFNAMISTIVSNTNSVENPVYLGPDLLSYFEGAQDQLVDKLHPSAAGYEAMAALWSSDTIATLPCPIMRAEPLVVPAIDQFQVWLPLVAHNTPPGVQSNR